MGTNTSSANTLVLNAIEESRERVEIVTISSGHCDLDEVRDILEDLAEGSAYVEDGAGDDIIDYWDCRDEWRVHLKL